MISNKKWKSYSHAKINLGLHVLNRLENGYHEIETGYVFIEWADELVVQFSNSMHIEYSDPMLNKDDNSLVHKAVNILKEEGYEIPNLSITVTKKIPLGAGLGGGSSNAATTLLMLNKILDLQIAKEDLIKFGARLGADVPIFLSGKPSIAHGIGTDLIEANIQPKTWILTVNPGIFSSTIEAYQQCIPNNERDIDLKNELEMHFYEEWRPFIENDLELSVIPKHKIIGDFKDQMYDFGAVFALMSGSGSSVFGLFEQDFVALSAYEAFIQLGYKANLTRPDFSSDIGVYEIV